MPTTQQSEIRGIRNGIEQEKIVFAKPDYVKTIIGMAIVVINVFLTQIALAGPCENARRYEAFAQEKAREAYNMAMGAAGSLDIGGAMAAYGPAGEAQSYRALAQQAAAQCSQTRHGARYPVRAPQLRRERAAELKAKHRAPRGRVPEQQAPQQGENRQVAPPVVQNLGTSGYGPERTGAEWSPFVADLVPRAVASQIRQGDGYADHGDWNGAEKFYAQALSIDPNSQEALNKLNEARMKQGKAQNARVPLPPAPAVLPVPPAPPAQPALPPNQVKVVNQLLNNIKNAIQKGGEFDGNIPQ